MPVLIQKKPNPQAANSDSLGARGKANLTEVLRQVERDVERASARPQVQMVKRHVAAAMLGVSIKTLQRWHKRGYGPARSINYHFHYKKSEIEEWIAKHGRGGRRCATGVSELVRRLAVITIESCSCSLHESGHTKMHQLHKSGQVKCLRLVRLDERNAKRLRQYVVRGRPPRIAQGPGLT